MNANLIAAIKAVVEQILEQKSLVTKAELNDLIAQRIASELDVGMNIDVSSSELTSVSAPVRVFHASGRKPTLTPEERRRKRADYQKKYRARERAAFVAATQVQGESSSMPVPVSKAVEVPVRSSEAAASPPKTPTSAVKNGANIAYVPSVDLDV